MADVRVNIGRRSRVANTQVGVQVNTFGLDKLIEGINGKILEEIAYEALEPSRQAAYDQWPVLTGASRDSIELATVEVTERAARVALQVGGEKLISDPRNKSHKDYAPYLEFNGSPSGSAPPGIIRNAIYDRDREIREAIHSGTARRIVELTK